MLWVGEDGRYIRDGWALTEANSKILASHWRSFENYAKPKSRFRVSRFQLRAIQQEQHETIDAFMTNARITANYCEYTDKDEQLMDTLIAGLYCDSIRRKLIDQNKETTLDQALAIVRAYEETQMDDIQDTRHIQSVSKQHVHKAPEKMRTDLHGCYRCGKTHSRNDKCLAADSICRYCNVVGHWACVCLTKKRDSGVKHQKQQLQQHQNRSKSKHTYRGRNTIHTVCDKNNTDKDEHFVLDSIETAPIAKIESIYKKGSKSQAFANIHKRGQTTVECKIDSEAEVNVMPLRVYKHLFPQQKDIHGRSVAL